MRNPASRVVGVAAAGLALVLVGLALVSARTLALRDQAVRDGLLLRLGYELEGLLREAGPEGVQEAASAFFEQHRSAITGVEVLAGREVIGAAGVPEGPPVTMPVFPGPAWRGRMGEPAMGPRARRMPAMRLQARIYPAPDLGRSRGLALLLVAGSLVAGLGLLAFGALAVRGLAQRQQLAAAEAERRRLETVALAGAGLAHRIRNPLAAIKGTAQLLADHRGEGVGERAGRIVAASERIDALVGRLLEFARPPEPYPEEVDLVEMVRELAARTPGPVKVPASGAVPVLCDREQLEAMVEELLANARALDPEGEIEVGVAVAGGRAVVEVRDRGPGLAMSTDEAFSPYVTTRPDGTGLGLAIVRSLAAANGGQVSLAARSGGGCVAALVLPVAGV